MSDIVSSKVRSRMMAGIRGKDTKPELIIRKALYAHGFRYRIHDKRLPGKPDLAFPRFRAVIEINGCFWHRHRCHLFKWPSTRKDFWREKIRKNRERDLKNQRALAQAGWRVLVIWECAIKGRTRRPLEAVVKMAAEWLESESKKAEIRGLGKMREKLE